MTEDLERTRLDDILDEDVPFEQFLTYRLLTLTGRLNRQAIKILEANGDLRLPEWRCLAMIGRHGMLNMNRISEMAGMDRGLVSRAIHGLVDKGYVLCDRDVTDRRIVRATLTKAGDALFRETLPIMQERQRQLLRGLSSSDRKAVFRIIDRLTDTLDTWEEEWDGKSEAS